MHSVGGGRALSGNRAAILVVTAVTVCLTGCASVPPTVVPAPVVGSAEPATATADETDGRGPHAGVEEADVLDLVAALNQALAGNDVEAWLSHFDLDEEATQQQRHWFAAVQDVPMEVRELVVSSVLGVDPQRGQKVQVAFRHQVSGADVDPSLEYYRWTVHRDGEGAPPTVVEATGAGGFNAAHPQLWDLTEVHVHESDSLVLLAPADLWPEVGDLVPSLDEAAAETLAALPVEGVDRVVVTLAHAEHLEELFGSRVDVADVAGFVTTAWAAPEADPGQVGDPREPLAVTGRVVLDAAYAVDEWDYLEGAATGGSPVMRHETAHLSLLLELGELGGPVWGVEGLATWWESEADAAAREDLLWWSQVLTEDVGLAPAWPPADVAGFFPDDLDLVDRHYTDAGLVFVHLAERFGADIALAVGADLHRQEGYRSADHIDEVLAEHTGLTTEQLQTDWQEWVEALPALG